MIGHMPVAVEIDGRGGSVMHERVGSGDIGTIDELHEETEDNNFKEEAELEDEELVQFTKRLESLHQASTGPQQIEKDLQGNSFFAFWLESISATRFDPYTPNARFFHPVYDTIKLFWKIVTLITAG